ncbi:MAG: hypothetical protein AMXMBFR59_28960 [Rhodanobacteraceae bacterium]
MAPGTEQRLLYRVLGQRRITRDARGHGIQRTHLALDEAPERIAISMAGPGDPFVVDCHGRMDEAGADPVSTIWWPLTAPGTGVRSRRRVWPVPTWGTVTSGPAICRAPRSADCYNPVSFRPSPPFQEPPSWR